MHFFARAFGARHVTLLNHLVLSRSAIRQMIIIFWALLARDVIFIIQIRKIIFICILNVRLGVPEGYFDQGTVLDWTPKKGT